MVHQLGQQGERRHRVDEVVQEELLAVLLRNRAFLAAGSVIHSVGTRDLRRMGRLGTRMPFVRNVFIVGSLALVGIPILNGFWSKELILEIGLEHERPRTVAARYSPNPAGRGAGRGKSSVVQGATGSHDADDDRLGKRSIV